MRVATGLGVMLAALSMVAMARAEETVLLGRWAAEDGTVTVRLSPCEARGDHLCATVVQEVLEPGETSSLGKVAVSSIVATGAKGWRGRYVDGGADLPATFRLEARDALKVTVCVAPLLCQTDRFRRVAP